MAVSLRRETMRKAAILDVDGTLVDSNDAHARAWVEAFTEAGILVDHERVRRAIGMGGDKLMPHVSGLAEDSPEGERIGKRRSEIFTTRYLPHLQPFPRVRELVQRLVDDGFTVVVASSAKEDELQGLLERAGVADLIDGQTSSDDAERSKPDPDIVRAALERSRAAADCAVMLGDTPYDVEAARRTGIAIAGVESGGWPRADLTGAVEVYADPADLCHRYDHSAFGRLARRDAGAGPEMRRAIDMRVVAIVAASVAGVALMVMALRAFARRPPRAAEDSVQQPRCGLSARDRERLRRIIARTS